MLIKLPLRPIWRDTPVLAAVTLLLILFTAMRLVGLFGPTAWRVLLPLSFVLMAAAPFVLLGAKGRRQIGLKRAGASGDYLLGVAVGATLALACGFLGSLLYGNGSDHWYVSIAAYYRRQLDTDGMGRLRLHLIFTLPALLVSPIGEELFFRGLMQRALQARVNGRRATTIESAVFGLVHLGHHGLFISAAGAWGLLAGSGALWVLLMAGVAAVFAWLRLRSDSIGPAIAAHAAFNATMNAYIFGVLWG